MRRVSSGHQLTPRNLPLAGTTLDLSRFSSLRQVEFTTVYPEEEERILISSIASTDFQKVVFTPLVTFDWEVLSVGSLWALFDDAICGLADKLRTLGSQNALEVELCTVFAGFGTKEQQNRFLPKFREKGRVKVSCVLDPMSKVWPVGSGV